MRYIGHPANIFIGIFFLMWAIEFYLVYRLTTPIGAIVTQFYLFFGLALLFGIFTILSGSVQCVIDWFGKKK